jgi:uncharacterized membrane protein (UPF0136 family)
MKSSTRRAAILGAYGLFLFATGLYGYQITVNHSYSSLFNGSIFGVLFVVLALLHAYGRTWTHTAALSASLIFFLTFLWRASKQLVVLLHQGYDPNVVHVAALLAFMAAISGVLALVLWKSDKR